MSCLVSKWFYILFWTLLFSCEGSLGETPRVRSFLGVLMIFDDIFETDPVICWGVRGVDRGPMDFFFFPENSKNTF